MRFSHMRSHAFAPKLMKKAASTCHARVGHVDANAAAWPRTTRCPPTACPNLCSTACPTTAYPSTTAYPPGLGLDHLSLTACLPTASPPNAKKPYDENVLKSVNSTR